MLKKLLIMVASIAFLATVTTTTASAAPPEDVEAMDYFGTFLDVDEGKSIFINMRAADLCDWVLGGFAGPPPVVDNAVPATVIPVGGGALVASITEELYIEVYELDNPDGPYLGACEDIAEQLAAETGPWATGTASVNTRTNNLGNFSDGRAASDNFNATASLTTESGDTYRYQISHHFNNQCADFACAHVNTTLRAT